MGRTRQVPADPLGGAVPSAQIMLCLGRPADALLATNPARFYETIGWEDGRTRCQLFRADVTSRIGDRATAAAALDSAAQWVLHSGSVEHLGLYHLVRARLASTRAISIPPGLRLMRACS